MGRPLIMQRVIWAAVCMAAVVLACLAMLTGNRIPHHVLLLRDEGFKAPNAKSAARVMDLDWRPKAECLACILDPSGGPLPPSSPSRMCRQKMLTTLMKL